VGKHFSVGKFSWDICRAHSLSTKTFKKTTAGCQISALIFNFCLEKGGALLIFYEKFPTAKFLVSKWT
jgi:hypothetical protein